jgi:hypothetical protein
VSSWPNRREDYGLLSPCLVEFSTSDWRAARSRSDSLRIMGGQEPDGFLMDSRTQIKGSYPIYRDVEIHRTADGKAGSGAPEVAPMLDRLARMQ